VPNRIILDLREVNMAIKYGKQRCDYAKNKAWRRPFDNPNESREEGDIQGCGAEIAIAQAYGLEWKPTIGELPHYDFVLPNGELLQVKRTKYGEGKLLITERDLTCHWYVCLRGVIPEFTIAGFIERRRIRPEWWGEKGQGRERSLQACWVIPNESLVRGWWW